jgi:glycerophosphoryl diester phosphodiesterase
MAGNGVATYFDTVSPRVFAHRGLAVEAPENTLLAFLHALAAGATHLETDVHSSADSHAVISHDADLSRVLGRDVRVDQLTRAELGRAALGHGQGFPSLREALDAFPEARFNVDVKSDSAIDPTVAAIRDARATERVLITSFSESRRVRTVAQLPGVATSASATSVLRVVAAHRLGSRALTARTLRSLDAVQVPESSQIGRIVTPRFVRAMHAHQIEVHVWTVNDPADMARLLDLGVDGIVTDRCDLAVKLIASRR